MVIGQMDTAAVVVARAALAAEVASLLASARTSGGIAGIGQADPVALAVARAVEVAQPA